MTKGKTTFSSSKYKEKQQVLIKLVPNHKEAVQYMLHPQHCMMWLEELAQHQANYCWLCDSLHERLQYVNGATACEMDFKEQHVISPK